MPASRQARGFDDRPSNYDGANRRHERFLAGSGPAQQQAEVVLLEGLSEKLGVKLERKRFDLEDGWFEVDGFSESPLVVCEVWAHLGMPKAGQKHKVMTDAAKLLLTKSILGDEARCILLFADPKAASSFLGSTWMAEWLREFKIDVEVLDLPQDLKARLTKPPRRSR
jgi:hypothetical protein